MAHEAHGIQTRGAHRFAPDPGRALSLDEWEQQAARDALTRVVGKFEDARRAPVLSDVLPLLGEASKMTHGDLSDAARERMHQSGLSVRFALNILLEEYPDLFDGDTSGSVNLDGKVTSFDVSQLPDQGPAVPVVMAIGHMWLLGRLRRQPGRRTNVIYEEGWHMIGGPSASLVQSNAKLSRSLGISNDFIMHKGTDVPQDSVGMAVIQEAQTVHIYAQERVEDAQWAQQAFNLDPSNVDELLDLRAGQYMLKYGSHPETKVEHLRSGWEAGLTDTNEAMAETVTTLPTAQPAPAGETVA